MRSTLTTFTLITLLILANFRLEATSYVVANVQEFNSAVLVVVPGDSIVLKKAIG